MEVECPDGRRIRIASCEDGHVFGRKHLGVAADDSISREQFRLSLVQGVADVAQLHVLGRNGTTRLLDHSKCHSLRVTHLRKIDNRSPFAGMIVEMPVVPGAAAGTPSDDAKKPCLRLVTPVLTVADDGAWELTDYLDQGMVCNELNHWCLLAPTIFHKFPQFTSLHL